MKYISENKDILVKKMAAYPNIPYHLLPAGEPYDHRDFIANEVRCIRAFLEAGTSRDRDGTCDKQLGFASCWKDWRNYYFFPIKLPI